MIQHTPGPWTCYTTGLDDDGSRLARMVLITGPAFNRRGMGLAVADARLIAAAPDLLAEAQANAAYMTAIIGALPPVRRAAIQIRIRETRAAIAKATGGTP